MAAAEATFNVGPSDKKLSMSLDEIIKSERGPQQQKKRPVGKDATMRNAMNTTQRKKALTTNAARQATEKRGKQIAAKRGLQPQQQQASGDGGQKKVKNARVGRFQNAAWTKQQQLREANARKKRATFGGKRGSLLGANLARATAAPMSSRVGRAVRRTTAAAAARGGAAVGGGRRAAAAAAGGPVSFKVKLSPAGQQTRKKSVQQRLGGARGRLSTTPQRQQQQRGPRVSIKQQTIGRLGNRLGGGRGGGVQQQQRANGGRVAAARQAGQRKTQRIVDERRGIKSARGDGGGGGSINDLFSRQQQRSQPQPQRQQQRQQQQRQPLAGRLGRGGQQQQQQQGRRVAQQQQQGGQRNFGGKKVRGRGAVTPIRRVLM